MTVQSPGGRSDAVNSGRLEEWFKRLIPGVAAPLSFERISGGRSNLTFLVGDRADGRWVLRRPPLGERLSSAHDMAREFRIISALQNRSLPVPPVVGLCEDESVNGAPFYVTEFVDGRVLRSQDDLDLAPSLEERREIGESLVETLAALHAIEPESVGLGDLSRTGGYIERQLRRWQGQWEKSKTRDLPYLDRVHERLSRAIPVQRGVSIVHGDYRLDNVIIDADGGVAAVLDWELCTLGDPLADLGLLLVYWAPEPANLIPGFDPATRAPGFPSRNEAADLYAAASGRDLGEIDFYVAFSLWRLAIILEGVRVRYAAGQYGEETWGEGEGEAAIARLSEVAYDALP